MKRDSIYVCLNEAAELVGIDARTLKKFIQSSKQINYKRVGNKLLVNKNKLFKVLDDEE